MRFPTSAPALLALALLSLPGALHAQVVFEEDFETPDIPNYLTVPAGQQLVTATNTWVVTANSIDLFDDPARAEAVAWDGTQAVDLTGSPDAGVMEAVFATQPGTEYELVFHYARNNFLGATVGMARVDVIGVTSRLSEVVSHDPGLIPFDQHQTFQGTFVADSSETTLRFTALNNGIAGITVDGISVTATGSADVGGSAAGAHDGILAAGPNPFRPFVHVDYAIARRGPVTLEVFDLSGRRIDTLVHGVQDAGRHRATWAGIGRDGAEAAPGVYVCVLTTPEGRSSRRIVRTR